MASTMRCDSTTVFHTDFCTDDRQSSLEEPPETPAPLFAVRAFKTAIFGTPHPGQDNALDSERRQVQSSIANVEKSLQQRQPPQAIMPSLGFSEKLSHNNKVDPSASPAKGILLTPGTAVGRRKTVSFGELKNSMVDGTDRDPAGWKTMKNPLEVSRATLPSKAPCPESKNETSLTKASFKAQLQASKKRVSSEADQEKLKSRALLFATNDSSPVAVTHQIETSAADTTIDLSQPRSRSGQHWKAEYELYHKNSAREMKKIIKYGQNAKSYALKKDSEATNLGEKLKRELSRLAIMEERVSKLATQLANTPRGDTDGDVGQTNLISDLAKQTTLAVRHKQKASMYQKAIETNNSIDPQELVEHETWAEPDDKNFSHSLATKADLDEPPSELFTLRARLESFKVTVKCTEEKAGKVEEENFKLKSSLARVKEKMNSYETRRLAREQKLRNREVKLQLEKQDCEKRLVEITRDYQRLLHLTDQPTNNQTVEHYGLKPQSNDRAPFRHMKVELQTGGVVPRDLGRSTSSYKDIISMSPQRQRRQESVSPTSRNVQARAALPAVRDTVVTSIDDEKGQTAEVPQHDHKPMTHSSHVDIWTMGSPGNVLNSTQLSKGLAHNSGSDLLPNETNDALQEINQNLGPDTLTRKRILSHRLDHPIDNPISSPKPVELDASLVTAGFPSELSVPSVVRKMQERRLNIGSPRPSMVNFDSNPLQHTRTAASLQSAVASGSRNTLIVGPREQRRSSIVSSSTRTSSMTSARRHSALPAERAAAAKARLQRRSMEKQKLRGSSKGFAQV